MATRKAKAKTKSKAGKAKKKPAASRGKTPKRAPAKTKKKAVKKKVATVKTKSKPKKSPAKKAAPAKKAPAKAKAAAKKPAAGKPRKSRGRRGKVLSREFMEELARTIRDGVEGHVRAAKGREVVGAATSGDATFELDRVAERALLNFLKNKRQPVAYYSEDSGYTTFTSGAPEHLLVVDPIDGTRAAKSGFEACVVSVASTRVIERPRIADVDNAVILEIVGDRLFYAERGQGCRIYQDGHLRKPKLSRNTSLEMMSWSMTVPARPAELIFPTAAKLVDLTSLKGGFFACNSTSFSLTRLVTNQLDACVDFANRYLRDIPSIVKDQFINAGRGVILNIAPYDIAASLLVAREAGCIVTDAYGKPLDDVLLLDSSVGNQQSMLAAANLELYDKLLSFFDTRIRQFEQLLKRRAQFTS
jgi:myo-inositol-1(or 4)-monophosphatase